MNGGGSVGFRKGQGSVNMSEATGTAMVEGFEDKLWCAMFRYRPVTVVYVYAWLKGKYISSWWLSPEGKPSSLCCDSFRVNFEATPVF